MLPIKQLFDLLAHDFPAVQARVVFRNGDHDSATQIRIWRRSAIIEPASAGADNLVGIKDEAKRHVDSRLPGSCSSSSRSARAKSA
jgi:hypothetical protein